MKKLRTNKKKVLELSKVTYNRPTKKAIKNVEKIVKTEDFKKPKEKDSKKD